jgi:RNA polymerase sigma factor (sigma-70 family)
LAADNMGLVYRAIQQLRIAEPWRQEAESDGMLGLIYAARSYDPASKTKFGTYAYVCIERKMKNTLQRLANQNKRRVDPSESADGLEVVVDAPEVLDVPERVPLEYRSFGALATLVVALPQAMREALRLTHVEGQCLRQVAAALACSSEQVRRLLRAAWHQLAEDLGRCDAPRAGTPWTDEDDALLDRVATIPDRAGQRVALMLAARQMGRTVGEMQARLDGEQ